MRKIIASWMIALVLMFPIYSANVLAFSTLRITGASGNDLVDGFIKKDDVLLLGVEAFYDKGRTAGRVTNSMVRLVVGDNKFPFHQCQERPTDSGYYTCGYNSPIDNLQDDSLSILVKLFDENGNGIARSDNTPLEAKTELYVDNIAPIVSPVKVSQDENGLRLDYTIRDNNPSSGLNQVVVTEDFKELVRFNLNLKGDKRAAIIYTNSSLIRSSSTTSANRTYRVTAVDRLGNSGEGNKTIFTDFSKPQLVSNSLQVIDNTPSSPTFSQVIHGLSGVITKEIIVRANFTDDGVTETNHLKSVLADFTRFGGTNGVLGNKVGLVGVHPSDPSKKMVQYEWIIKNPKPSDNGRITFNITDKMGNLNSVPVNYILSVENTPPAIIPGSFQILVDGFPVDFLGGNVIGNKIGFEVKLKEEYPGLTASNVELDLSNIGGGTAQKASSCIANSTTFIWTCKWDSVLLSRVESSQSFVLKVKDNAGVQASIPISKSIGVDNTEPEVEYFGSVLRTVKNQNVTKKLSGIGAVTFNSYLMESGNEIILKVKETESGINPSKVKLKGFPGGTYSADSCDKSGDVYTCVWKEDIGKQKVVIGDQMQYLTEISAEYEDNANHKGIVKRYVMFDNEDPVIRESVTFLTVDSSGKREFHVGGDVIEATVIVYDKSPPKLGADFRSLSITGFPEGDCTELEQGRWKCSLDSHDSPAIPIQGGKPEGYEVELIVVDVVNRSTSMTAALISGDLKKEEIFGAREDSGKIFLDVAKTDKAPVSLDLWKVGNVNVIPEGLDSEIVEIAGDRAYFSIDLLPTGNAKDAEIVDINHIKNRCVFTEGDDFGPEDRVSEIGIMNNNGADKTNPYIYIDIKPGVVDFEYFELTCELAIRSFYDFSGERLFLPKAEVDNVTFSVGFYNEPLGTIAENVLRKSDSVRDGWIGPDSNFGKTIGFLTEIATIANGVCTIMGLWETVLVVWKGINVGLDAIRWFFGGGGVPQASCGAEKANEQVFDLTWSGMANSMCAFMSCRWSMFGDGLIPSPDQYLMDKFGGPVIDTVVKAAGNIGKKDSSGEVQGPTQSGAPLGDSSVPVVNPGNPFVSTADSGPMGPPTPVQVGQPPNVGFTAGIPPGISGSAVFTGYASDDPTPEWARHKGVGPLKGKTDQHKYSPEGLAAKTSGILSAKPSPFKSLIVAMNTGCIPGIVAGLERYRQASCQFVDCLENEITKAPIGINECDALYHYTICKYVVSDVVNMMGFAALYDSIRDKLRSAFQDPMSLVGAVSGPVCTYLCSTSGLIANACSVHSFAGVVASLYNDLKGMKENAGESLYSPQGDMCADL